MTTTDLLQFAATVLVAAVPGFFAYRSSSRQAREARRAVVDAAAAHASAERQKLDLEQQRQHDATVQSMRETYEGILRSLRREVDRLQQHVDRLERQAAAERTVGDTLRARVAALEGEQVQRDGLRARVATLEDALTRAGLPVPP